MEDNIEVYPKCPHCQVDLEDYDQIDTDYEANGNYFVTWAAICPQCQRTFLFREDFKLVERKFIR